PRRGEPGTATAAAIRTREPTRASAALRRPRFSVPVSRIDSTLSASPSSPTASAGADDVPSAAAPSAAAAGPAAPSAAPTATRHGSRAPLPARGVRAVQRAPFHPRGDEPLHHHGDQAGEEHGGRHREVDVRQRRDDVLL